MLAMNSDSRIQGLDSSPVRLPAGAGRADSALRRLTVAGKPFYVLRQRGTLADIAYDHGRLLAAEIEQGVFPEILSAIARGTDLGGPLRSGVADALFRALSNRIVASVSDEFRNAMGALADGYRDALPAARFSRQQVIDAVVAIELDNLADGLSRRLQMPSLQVRAEAIGQVLELCTPDIMSDALREFFAGAESDVERHGVLAAALARMSHPDHRSGFSCTGFSIPGGMTADGRHLHARNLDADLYNWNLATTLFLIDETVGRADWHRYVAFGTAGLIYPGGISGLNDAGIATSLHQLSTTRYRTRFAAGRADLAPFVQQRILREASSLDEAVDIARTTQAFAAWVIFCSDARSGRSRRIEFNGEAFRVGPEEKGPSAQTNHFRDPDLVEHLFDDRDAHYTPSFGKWLETRSRLAMVEHALAEKSATANDDIDWAIDLLASGRDWQLIDFARRRGLDPATTGVERSFGRVPRKAYGQLSSIVRGDPARRAGLDEAWMTAGDRLPACQSIFIGWRIDWEGFDLQPVEAGPLRCTRQFADTGRVEWESSFETYVAARVASARPRDATGALLTHASDATQRAQDATRAEALLSRSIDLATEDGIVEVPYHYMRARIRHQLGQNAAAKADWDLLRAIWGDPPVATAWPVAAPCVQPVLHEYEAGLVLALSVMTEDRLCGRWDWDGRTAQLQAAKSLLVGLRDQLFGVGAPAHFDLQAWIDRIDAIMTRNSAEVTLPEPNFVTVE
jgi:hypothetical protein